MCMIWFTGVQTRVHGTVFSHAVFRSPIHKSRTSDAILSVRRREVDKVSLLGPILLYT